MRYYVFKDESGTVVGYNQTEAQLPPPAIEVNEQEFNRMGFCSEHVPEGSDTDEVKLLKAQLQAQTERSDFIEDCIAEMATVVYGGV